MCMPMHMCMRMRACAYLGDDASRLVGRDELAQRLRHRNDRQKSKGLEEHDEVEEEASKRHTKKEEETVEGGASAVGRVEVG